MLLSPRVAPILLVSTEVTSCVLGIGRQVFRSDPEQVSGSSTMSSVGPASRFLVVGLGNHGMEKTRHSIGMQIVSKMAMLFDQKLEMDKHCRGHVAHMRSVMLGDTDTTEVVLLKPKLLMNVNGRSIAATYKKYEIASPQHVLVIHDDLDRSFGKLSVKQGGSASGHNGVKSTIQCLNSEDFARLRVGIDRPQHRDHVSDYVLSAFTAPERNALEATTLNEACDKVLSILGTIYNTGTAVVPQKRRRKRQRNA
eukprot:m.26753 g.26753  ORF g.26753 m.26753 type:complete len:253 (-) comp13380_c0_seq2:49-807(-)